MKVLCTLNYDQLMVTIVFVSNLIHTSMCVLFAVMGACTQLLLIGLFFRIKLKLCVLQLILMRMMRSWEGWGLDITSISRYTP